MKEVWYAHVPGAWLRIVVPDLEIYARSSSLDKGDNGMPYSASHYARYTLQFRNARVRIDLFKTNKLWLEPSKERGIATLRNASLAREAILVCCATRLTAASLYVEAQK